jgi:uncharacterized protein CbrC (UPF0167 family)
MEIERNKNGVNKNIKAHILNDVIMREIGFTDYDKNTWYFMRMIKGVNNISFNVSINKKNEEDLKIDVLDDNFCQPYDYQYMLENNPTFRPCLLVKEQVEEWMKYLEDKGVISGHIYGEYI